METHTIKLDTEVVGTRTLFAGKTKKIELNKYYDLDGTIINEGKDTINYDSEVPFEIIEKKIKYNWEYISPQVLERWEIKVNGMRICTDVELTGYKVLKTKLVLSGCTGAG